MADEFDPLKQKDNKPIEELYATIQKNTINNNTNDDDLLRNPFENILKSANNQTNKPPEQQQQQQQQPQQAKEEIYQKLNYTNNAYKAPIRSTNPFDQDVQKPLPPTNVIQQLPQEKPIVSEQKKQQYGGNTEHYQDQNYETEPPPYCSEEYYEDHEAHKRRGFAGAMDRLVQRFPALGMFHKPPAPLDSYENYETEQGQEYVEEESMEAPQLVEANSSARELTADELALNERYSNKSRTQIIQLQKKDQTQPVDVCIHHDSYTLYSCDVGRSVVEIFDMYGKLQHVIDDQTTIKLQPTSIAVAYDGTIIVASHFNHRLHMYSPDDNQDENVYDGYRFKQYKLGSPGHDLHQFYYPAGVAIDFSDGYLYVCDRGNYRIQVMRPEGVCERVIDLISLDQKQSPVPPIQIAHQKNGDKIVCVIGTGDAICFTSKYGDGPTYVEPLYILDNDGLGLQGASGLALDSNDRIFISDTGHHRIVICTPEGSYITHIGVEGDGPGELKRPCGLDITNDGTIVIADSGNKRLQLFGSIREQSIEVEKSKKEKPDDKNILLIDPEASIF